MDTIKPTAPVQVAICVSTFLRPLGVARLLESIGKLEFSKNQHVALQVIVIDNDSAGSAGSTVERVAEQISYPVRYAIEPQRGISFARNRAVALAADCDYVAFVDDDEVVEPTWMDELLDAQRQYHAEVVTGPVAPIFEFTPPAWLVGGRFIGVRRFSRVRRPTGTRVPYASSANLLIKRSILDAISGPFDSRWALSGGSDDFLTMQLARAGASLIWCEEAVVNEFVPPSRMRVKWILQRSFRVGNTVSLFERELEPNALRVVSRAVRGAGCIALGLAGLIPALFWGRATAVSMLTYSARGAGILLGMVGYRFEEYRHVHGA